MSNSASGRPRGQTNPQHDSSDEGKLYHYKQSRHAVRTDGVDRAKRQSSQKVDQPQHDEDSGAMEADQNSDDEKPSYESDEDQEGARHPYYNYATEKSDVAADAKLIYQRHRMDTESESGGSPFLTSRSFTMPPGNTFDGIGLARTPSLSSRKSGPSQKILTAGLGPPAISSLKPRDLYTSLQDSAVAHNQTLADLVASANTQAQGQPHHPHQLHEFKDPLLLSEGVHGAGAGVGQGTGPDGFAKNDAAIVSEVEAICDKIKHILDLRQSYMKVSSQCPGDNPKDDQNWNIYPAPPEPVWNEEKKRPSTKEDGNLSASSSLYIADGRTSSKDGFKWDAGKTAEQNPSSPTTAKRRRKAGIDIGEDFDINECEIPGRAARSFRYEIDQGSVYQVYDESGKPLASVPTLRDYYMALDEVIDIASDGPAKSFAYRRLQYLEGRYQLYTLLNEYEEVADTKKVPHRDFYNIRKVDTHVHHSACMNQKHLLRFIKSKMKKCPDEVVIDRDGKQLTLSQVFESIHLTAYDLSIDTLDMHAHTDSFHRFDKFNLKYNPIGQSRLRDIFLKTDNFIKGRYLAEITREVIADLESSKYQMVEWRISIYGRNINEWDKLAAWVVDNKLFSPNVRWLIQIPRLFSLYKSLNTMENFEQLIRNIFQPLFEVTEDPSSHPKLHIFLQRVIGFDSVDDESKPERRFYRKYPTPKDWNTKQNPPYGYWVYYLFANMTSLNAWRRRRGFNTFLLRPHCGEAGDIDHLAAAVLCCHSISHGITLRKVPMLQYIFYLDQIGIAMSPLSNNALFLTYDRNPFISYFRKGLNVSLSTDDPLQFAFTKEPLIEEYSVAAQIYKLSAVDMSELAKHSVDQCGFELALKQRWLGRYCYLPGVLGNDVKKCNVPDIREAYRHETLKSEHAFIARYTSDYAHLERCTPSMPDPSDPSTPISEVYKTLESPRHYYATVADSIPPAQLARQPTSSGLGIGSKASELDKLVKSGRQQRPISPVSGRRRTGSRSSIHSKSPSHADSDADHYISGREPRAFPGAVYGQVKRRNSIRSSTTELGGLKGSATWTAGVANSGSAHDHSTDDGRYGDVGLRGNTTVLEPGLAKMRLKEDLDPKEIGDSD